MKKALVKKVLREKNSNPKKSFKEIFQEIGFEEAEAKKAVGRFNYYRKKYDLENDKDFSGSNMKKQEPEPDPEPDPDPEPEPDPDPEPDPEPDQKKNVLINSLKDIKEKVKQDKKEEKKKQKQKKQEPEPEPDPEPDQKIKIKKIYENNKIYVYGFIGLILAGLALRYYRKKIIQDVQGEEKQEKQIQTNETGGMSPGDFLGIEKAEY